MSRKIISSDGLFINWRNLCLFLFVSPLAALAFAYLMSTEAAPQWVQAIGSVFAILAAIWVSNRQHREQLRRARHNEQTVSKVLIVAALNSEVCIQLIFAALAKKTELNEMPVADYVSHLRDNLEVVSNADLNRLPHPNMVWAVFALRAAIRAAIGNTEKYTEGVTSAEQTKVVLIRNGQRLNELVRDLNKASSLA